MKKFTKILSVLLSVLFIWQSFGANLGLKASAAGTDELSVALGAAQPGATINNIKTYYYPDAVVTGSGIKTILLSFSENVTSGDKIILPDSPSGFVVSGTSASNDYTKRVNIDTGASASDVQSYLQKIGFQLAGTSQSVKVTITTQSIQYDTFYEIDTQHYYQYVPFSTTTNATWVDAYNSAKNLEYMGRSGYLATVTSYDEDVFLNKLSNGSVGWLGGTALTNNGESGSLYYSGFNTSVDSGDNWYWADGPERGRIFYYGRSTNRSSNGDGTSPYWNWGNSGEPNGSTATNGENCLSTLNRLSIDQQKGYHDTDFSWNDIVWNTEYEGDFSAKGFFVEYGNMTPGDTAACAEGYASVTGSLSSTSYAASISGSAVYGQTLTANLNEGSATAYQWIRDDGSISGATGQTYTLTADDVGHQIAVRITVGGTAVTSPTVEATALPIAGSGSALSFDGTDDYVDLGASNSNLALGNTFTEEAWVYPKQIKDYVGIVGNELRDGCANTRAPSIYLCGGGSCVHAGFGDGDNWNSLTTDSVLTLNSWNHIAFVYNDSTMSIYVNGILRASQNCTATPCSTSIRNIGRISNYPTDDYFKGQLDEVKIWNTAHTQDEVRSDMYSHPASGASGLVGYWNLDESAGSVAKDSSSNGNSGTLTNMDTANSWGISGAWQNRITAENTAITMDAGYSRDGGNITIAPSSAPSYGTLAFDNSAKTVTYTPTNGYYGTDNFTYTVTEYGVSKSYTIAMTVVQTPDVSVVNQAATVGGTATFTADGSVGSGTLTYQWQKSTDGTNWSNVTDGSGGNTGSYTTPALVYTDNSSQYRCLATNTIGFTSVSSTSAAASLTVNKKKQGGLTVTGPTNNTLTYGDTFRLFVSGGDGSGGYSYQSDHANILTVDGSGKLTAVGTGAANITVTRAGDSDYGDSTPVQVSITVNPKPLDVTITPNDKTYDGGTTADVKSVGYAGFVNGDDAGSVFITGVSLAFSDGNAENGKTVSASGYSLSGAKKDDYKIGTLTVNNANINKRAVTPTATANSRIYDGSTVATGTISLSNVVNGDAVTASGNFAFDNKNARLGKNVNVTSITLNGAKARNYALSTTSATATANITQKSLTVTNTEVKDKTYDGKTSAEFSGAPALSGVITGDIVTLTNGTPSFESANASDSVKVDFSDFSISGNDTGNYSLIQPSSTTANITRKTLTVSVNPISIRRGQFINNHITVDVKGFVSGESSSNLTWFTAPTATANANEDNMTPGQRSIPITYSDGNSTGNYQFDESNTTAQLTVSSVAVGSGDYTVTGRSGSWSESSQNLSAWSNENLTVSPSGSYTQISSDGSQWKNSLTISSEAKNGSYPFYLRNSSDGTQTDSKTIYYNLDKTAPTGLKVTVGRNEFTNFLHTITFGLFFKDTVDVSFSAADDSSGIDHYEYQMVDISKGQTYNAGGTWSTYTGSLNVTPQFKGTIYARAFDKAGNMTASEQFVQTDGLVADSQTPRAPTVVATVDGSNYNGGWTSGDVKLVASGSMALSGINHYEYSKDGTNWTPMPDQSGAADSTTGRNIPDTLTIAADMNGDIHFRAVSNSTVPGDESVVTVKRDSVIPSIHVAVSGTTGQWTEDQVAFTLSNTENNISPVIYWVKIGSEDWTQISGDVYQVTGNVNTTYQFKVVSGSNLTSSASDTYTVKLASDALKAVIGDIDGLPDPSGATDKQITDSEQAIKDAKIIYDTLNKDEQSAIGQSRIDKLNQLISRLNAILVIIPKDTGTGITASNIGTSVQLPELNDPGVGKIVVKLMVNPIASSTHSNIAVASERLSNSGSSLVATYDVSLIKSVFDVAGNQTSSGKISNSNIKGPITIRIPVPVEYQERTNLQVVYIDDSGNVTPLATTLVTVDGVQYLQFTATHFSMYAVTASNEKVASIPNPKTGDTNDSLPDNTVALFSLVVLSTSAAAVAHKKRRKAVRCRHL